MTDDLLAYEEVLLEGLSNKQKALYLSEMSGKKKSKTTAIVLALCLGGIGFHHFYLGKVPCGILSIMFCWTFVPAVIALVECFGFIQKRVDAKNREIALAIVQRVQLLMD